MYSLNAIKKNPTLNNYSFSHLFWKRILHISFKVVVSFERGMFETEAEKEIHLQDTIYIWGDR